MLSLLNDLIQIELRQTDAKKLENSLQHLGDLKPSEANINVCSCINVNYSICIVHKAHLWYLIIIEGNIPKCLI